MIALVVWHTIEGGRRSRADGHQEEEEEAIHKLTICLLASASLTISYGDFNENSIVCNKLIKCASYRN